MNERFTCYPSGIKIKGDEKMEILQVKSIDKVYGTKENKVQALRNILFLWSRENSPLLWELPDLGKVQC